MEQLGGLVAENFGSLILSIVGIALAYAGIHAYLALERKKHEFELMKYEAERAFREEEYARFRDEPAPELAKHIADRLGQNWDWAKRAIEAANLASYTHTVFGERSSHFASEKNELAKRFAPYLLARCEHLIRSGRSVYLLIDAGTTLYPFFKEIGVETSRAAQRGERWVDGLHMATNNLPGLEQLMRWGRRVSHERYSPLAIRDCHLLPGVPLPVFGAVAGDETREAISRLRSRSESPSGEHAVFISLVVGNWLRVTQGEPRIPVPMARGKEHCEVKTCLVENSDEVYVVSPLGKNFVGLSLGAVIAGFQVRPDHVERGKRDGIPRRA